MSYVNIGRALKVHQVLPQIHDGKLQHWVTASNIISIMVGFGFMYLKATWIIICVYTAVSFQTTKSLSQNVVTDIFSHAGKLIQAEFKK